MRIRWEDVNPNALARSAALATPSKSAICDYIIHALLFSAKAYIHGGEARCPYMPAEPMNNARSAAIIKRAYFGIFMQKIGVLPILFALFLGFAFMFVVDLVKIYAFKKLNIH
ncbi:MAG: hypothetical protein ACP5HF_03400 [Candidatus Micrarchaeia archaeon]